MFGLEKVTNAGTFRFNKEDHTVGNLFRMQLLRDPSVRFAGYLHPHPLVYYVDLKIQTNNSTVAPVEVLSSAIEDLANQTDHLMTQFQEAAENWQRDQAEEFRIMGALSGLQRKIVGATAQLSEIDAEAGASSKTKQVPLMQKKPVRPCHL